MTLIPRKRKEKIIIFTDKRRQKLTDDVRTFSTQIKCRLRGDKKRRKKLQVATTSYTERRGKEIRQKWEQETEKRIYC